MKKNLFKQIFLCVASLCLFQCTSHSPSAELTPSNFHTGNTVVHSGFLTAQLGGHSPVSKIFVGFDGATPTKTLWIPNTLLIRLPAILDGVTPWKTGSLHTVTIQGYSIEGDTLFDKTFNVRRGLNTDINGDGYSDLIVGAPSSDVVSSNQGVVYVYHGSSSGITAVNQTLQSPDATDGDAFGIHATIVGDLNGDGFGDALIAGGGGEKLYVYLGSFGGLGSTPVATLTYPEVDVGPNFGYSVASAGDVNGDGYDDVVVGALLSDVTCSDCGAAYVYLGKATGLDTTAHVRLTYPGANVANASFSSSLSGGDIDGDGYSDIVVGSKMDDGGGTNRGSVYLYHGSSSGITNTVTKTLSHPGTDDTANFGQTVSLSSDFQDDGYADLVVGAPTADQDAIAADDFGYVYVYNGSASGASNTVSKTIASPRSDTTNFGNTVSSTGDMNGDGYTDLAVGAPQSDMATSGGGAVFIFHGSTDGIAITPAASLPYAGSDSTAQMGDSLFRIGYSSASGYCDLAVGVPSSDIAGHNQGALFIYKGTTAGASSTERIDLSYPGTDNSAGFGIVY